MSAPITDRCPICGSGPIFAGNAYVNGEVQDIYWPCACPEPTDEDAPNWLDDPDFIIEGESVLYAPPGWPDDFGHPGETADCPFDPTPPDQPNYLYGTE